MNRIINESENREAYEAGLITAEERERRDDEARTKCRAAIERDEAADDQRQIEKMREMGFKTTRSAVQQRPRFCGLLQHRRRIRGARRDSPQ